MKTILAKSHKRAGKGVTPSFLACKDWMDPRWRFDYAGPQESWADSAGK
jgi:hypothetical protein